MKDTRWSRMGPGTTGVRRYSRGTSVQQGYVGTTGVRPNDPRTVMYPPPPPCTHTHSLGGCVPSRLPLTFRAVPRSIRQSPQTGASNGFSVDQLKLHRSPYPPQMRCSRAVGCDDGGRSQATAPALGGRGQHACQCRAAGQPMRTAASSAKGSAPDVLGPYCPPHPIPCDPRPRRLLARVLPNGARGVGGVGLGWVGLGWTLPALVRRTPGGVGPPEAAHPSMKSLESGRPCSTP